MSRSRDIGAGVCVIFFVTHLSYENKPLFLWPVNTDDECWRIYTQKRCKKYQNGQVSLVHQCTLPLSSPTMTVSESVSIAEQRASYPNLVSGCFKSAWLFSLIVFLAPVVASRRQGFWKLSVFYDLFWKMKKYLRCSSQIWINANSHKQKHLC